MLGQQDDQNSEVIYNMAKDLFFFTLTFRSFLAETFCSLKHFGHLSQSCIITFRTSVS